MAVNEHIFILRANNILMRFENSRLDRVRKTGKLKWDQYKTMAINEHIFILRANNKTNQFFIYFLLDQQELSKLDANSAQPGLNQQAMKSFKIVIPPKNMMKSFEEIVKPWIDKILFNSNQIRDLEKLRDILLPKLMNGTVRINL